MRNHLYVDNSNFWIEGMRVSAVKLGLAPDLRAASNDNIVDPSYRVDFGKLLEYAGGNPDEIGAAKLYGSRPPENDQLWAMARRHGFKVLVHDRGYDGKEKKVDTHMSADMIEDLYTVIDWSSDEVTLVSGDADHVPAVEKMVAAGVKVHLLGWRHCTSRELIEASSSFQDLTNHVDFLRFGG